MVANTTKPTIVADTAFLFNLLSKEEKNLLIKSEQADWCKAQNVDGKAFRNGLLREALLREAQKTSDPARKEELEAAAGRFGVSEKLANEKKAAADAEAKALQEENVGPLREGKALPWFAKKMSNEGKVAIIATFVICLLIAALNLMGIFADGPTRFIFLLIAIPMVAYNVVGFSDWYRHWGINGKAMTVKTWVMPFIWGAFFLAFVNETNVQEEIWLAAGFLISLAIWFGFSHWLLKLEIMAGLALIALLILWDSSSLAANISRYETVMGDSNLPVTMGNIILKIGAWFLGIGHQLLGMAMWAKLHWVLLGYIILQPLIFREYVKARHFTQDLG